MVQAILAGRKTQTRRAVKPQPIVSVSRREVEARTWHVEIDWGGQLSKSHGLSGFEDGDKRLLTAWAEDHCPYGKPGNRLWVRESCTISKPYTDVLEDTRSVYYLADGVRHEGIKATPSIHMPRWASRITLEITGVRVERLQDISEEDAADEGVYCCEEIMQDAAREAAANSRTTVGPIDYFRRLWSKINGPGSWDANPWCWVVEFKRA